jgi:hypothetical protein
MNSHFVLCQFENYALEVASVSMHAFFKSGRETVHISLTASPQELQPLHLEFAVLNPR